MKTTWAVLLLLTTSALAGCTMPEPDATGDANDAGRTVITSSTSAPQSGGSASVYVQDAPTDEFAEIHLVFTSVEVHIAGDGSEDTEPSTGTETITSTETETNTTTTQTNTTAGNETETQTNTTSTQTNTTAGNETETQTNTTSTQTNTTAGNETETQTGTGSETETQTNTTAGNVTSETDTGTPEAGWRVLWSNPSGVDIDLLDAQDNRSAFLGEQDLPVGKYTQIRLHITAAYGIDHDGERHDFRVPSGKIRYVTPFEVEPGAETRILLDFDLDASLREQGEGWMLHPVIGRTDVAIVDDGQSGKDVHEEGEIVEEETSS